MRDDTIDATIFLKTIILLDTMEMLSSGQDYTGHVFTRFAGNGTDLKGTAFVDCSFERCSFTQANFDSCSFVHCSFKHCDMSLMKVPNSGFTDTQFRDSKVVGVDWTKAGARASGRGREAHPPRRARCDCARRLDAQEDGNPFLKKSA